MPGFEPLTGSLPLSPDRHIFRVGSDGAAQPTGATAPREPSRAIAPIREARPPAVEAPPPSLTVPEVEPRKTKPARRRRSTTGGGIAGELEATAIAALPAPESKPKRVAKKAAAGDGKTAKPAARRARTKKTEEPAEGEVKKAARKRKVAK